MTIAHLLLFTYDYRCLIAFTQIRYKLTGKVKGLKNTSDYGL